MGRERKRTLGVHVRWKVSLQLSFLELFSRKVFAEPLISCQHTANCTQLLKRHPASDSQGSKFKKLRITESGAWPRGSPRDLTETTKTAYKPYMKRQSLCKCPQPGSHSIDTILFLLLSFHYCFVPLPSLVMNSICPLPVSPVFLWHGRTVS